MGHIRMSGQVHANGVVEIVLVQEVFDGEGCSVRCVPSYMEVVLVQGVLHDEGCSGEDLGSSRCGKAEGPVVGSSEVMPAD